MNLTEEEIAVAKALKSKGYEDVAIAKAIEKNRFKTQSPTLSRTLGTVDKAMAAEDRGEVVAAPYKPGAVENIMRAPARGWEKGKEIAQGVSEVASDEPGGKPLSALGKIVYPALGALGETVGTVAEEGFNKVKDLPIIPTGMVVEQDTENTTKIPFSDKGIDFLSSLSDIGKNITDSTPEPVKKSLEEGVMKLSEYYNSLSPEAKKTADAIGFGLMQTLNVAGGAQAMPFVKGGLSKVGGVLGKGVQSQMSKLIPSEAGAKIVKEGGKRLEMAEGMMNSMIKVDPNKAKLFYDLSKDKTLGKFLIERDMIGSPEEVVKDLVDRFSVVKGNLDDAVSSIEGNYKFPMAKEALSEMQGRFTKTLDDNLGRVDDLLRKYDDEGLTLAENLELKRLYERKLKTGYLKEKNSEAIDRATNIDNGLREDFAKAAVDSGLENVKELSKEVQLLKTAMDAIELKRIKSLVNNQFSLTDNLLLIGGAVDPSALALLGIKKIGSTPAVQSRIIKALVTNDAKVMKDIPNIPKEIIGAKNDIKRKELFENWLESTGISKTLKGEDIKKLPPGTSIQSPPQTPESMLQSRSKQYGEGSGVFGQDLSVTESTKPISNIKSSSMGDSISADYGLLQAAKKYKSADEFVKAQESTGVFNDYNPSARAGGSSTENTPLTQLGYSPTDEIVVYRGVPKGVKVINDGDWVTTLKQLAKDYAGSGDVISKKVKASNLFAEKGDETLEELVYSAKTRLDKNQLTDIWNKANKK